MRYSNFPVSFLTWDLRNKSVFVRADLNTHADATFKDNLKYTRLLPTLNTMLDRGATIYLATHIGSPQGYNAQLSTQPLNAWFWHNGYPIGKTLHVQENLRFHPEEQTGSLNFACTLAQGMDYYIDDAFGSLHRTDTSLTILPRLFPPAKRSVGLLIHEELTALTSLFTNKRSKLLIVGGGKKDKLKTIAHALDSVEQILLCPGLTEEFVFPPAEAEEDYISLLKQHIATGKISLPIDYVVCNKRTPWQAPFSVKKVQHVIQEDMLISAGPETLQAWQHYINEAEMIIFNGPMGKINIPQSIEYTTKLLQSIVQSEAIRIIGGDDSLQLLDHVHMHQHFDYRSTGGGALLALLTQQMLPGLEALQEPMLSNGC